MTIDAKPLSHAKPTPPLPPPKPPQNPVFRMMGLPRISPKLPSRNWLIFLTITTSFTTTLLYDRYHKKKAQQKWCNLVSHIAKDSLPVSQMPRKITIFLSAPPGDGLRPSREFFQEYVKPILVAAALDWEVVEGRREGDVRAGLAEKIRKLRKSKGEVSQLEPAAEEKENMVAELRQRTGIRLWEGVQGDLVIGRHTWKEYIRGLHEGWLGPVDPPPLPESPPPILASAGSQVPISRPSDSTPLEDTDTPSDSVSQPDQPTPPAEPPKPSKPTTPTPPYLYPPSYSSSLSPPSLPPTLPPSLPLPFPHLLGILNTPTRTYRFLTRRHIADSTGRSVAALVLATHTRPYTHHESFPANPDSPAAAPDGETLRGKEGEAEWEQQRALVKEEGEWHKSAWKEGVEGVERVWKEGVVVDERIGERMSLFEMGTEDEERASADGGRIERERGGWGEVKGWVGLGGEEREKKGWEMGMVGEEGD